MNKHFLFIKKKDFFGVTISPLRSQTLQIYDFFNFSEKKGVALDPTCINIGRLERT